MCYCHSRKKKVQVLSSWYGIKKRRIYFNNFTIGSVGHSVTCLKNKHSSLIGNDVLVRIQHLFLTSKISHVFHSNVSRAVRGELITVYHNLYAKLKLVCVSLLNTFQILVESVKWNWSMHASCTGSSNGSFCLNQEWVDFINLETHVQI